MKKITIFLEEYKNYLIIISFCCGLIGLTLSFDCSKIIIFTFLYLEKICTFILLLILFNKNRLEIQKTYGGIFNVASKAAHAEMKLINDLIIYTENYNASSEANQIFMYKKYNINDCWYLSLNFDIKYEKCILIDKSYLTCFIEDNLIEKYKATLNNIEDCYVIKMSEVYKFFKNLRCSLEYLEK